MSPLAPRWRAELAWGALASVVFAAPSFAGQVALGRVLGRAQELAALLSLGSGSRLHLLLQPVDAAVGGVARLVALAAICWVLAWALLGRRVGFRGTLAATGRAARVLAWAPVGAGLVGGLAAWVWFEKPSWAGEPALWELAYPAMHGWLAVQGLLWLWFMARLARGLASEHRMRAGEAACVAFAPAWALLLVSWI